MPLHPDFPVIEGDVKLTDRWMLTLPAAFSRRLEEGNLVIWRPGLTLWLSAWGTEDGVATEERVASVKAQASPDAKDWAEATKDGVTRLSYCVTEAGEDGKSVHSLNAFAYADDGQILAAFYSDDPTEILVARQIADSIRLNGAP